MSEAERGAALMALSEHLAPMAEMAAGFKAHCVGAGLSPESADAAAGELLVQSIRYLFRRGSPPPQRPSWLTDLLRGRNVE